MSTDALAQWSNTFVSGAMIVLTLTVLVFAVDFAVGSGRRRALQADRERQAARVAGTTGDVGRVAVVPERMPWVTVTRGGPGWGWRSASWPSPS